RLLSVAPLSVPHPLAYTGSLESAGADQRDRSWYFDWFQTPEATDELLADGAERLRAVYTATGLTEADADAYVDRLGDREALDAALNWYRASGIELIRGLGPITVSTLHVWSTEDLALGPEAAHATGDHVEGPYRFEALEGVGHWIPEQAADRCTELLLTHFAGADAP
ncbi:MAG: alpha/beta hydrolase, partial [Actinomycetota bacterium]